MTFINFCYRGSQLSFKLLAFGLKLYFRNGL